MVFKIKCFSNSYHYKMKMDGNLLKRGETMKRIALLLLGLALCFTGIAPAHAAITAPTISKLSERIVGEGIFKGDKLYTLVDDYSELVLYDVKTGISLRRFDESYGGKYIAVSDDEKYVALGKDQSVNIYDSFGEVTTTIKTVTYGAGQMEMKWFDGGAFVPGTSVLILSGDGKLAAYDVVTNQVKWMRGAESGTVMTSETYVLVEDEKHGRLYTHTGEFVQEWLNVNDMSISRDDRLVVATSQSVSSYEAGRYTEPKYKSNKTASRVKIESSGQFVVIDNAVYSFDLKKIHLNHYLNERSVSLSPNGKYMMVSNWYDTEVYATNGFGERPISAYIPTAYQKLTAGTSYNASLSVKTASGKTVSVKEDVVWTTNSPQTAYISGGKIIAKSKGTVTLKATYEGFTAQRTITVLPDPRPSDHSWLLSQKKQMIRGTFLDSPHKLYGDYAKVKGPVGTFESDYDFMYKGRHQGDFMYTSTSKPQKINIITMSPALQKRDITKYEFQKAFGKPRDTYQNYWETFTFTRAGKTLKEYYIQEVAEYKINNKLPMYVFYDSNYRVRYISLYSK